MPDCYFLIKAETVILNRSSQNVLRKHSLFDKTKEIVSKEERRLLIKLTIVKKTQQWTFVRIVLILFDRSHPSLHWENPGQMSRWTSNCLPTDRFRPFFTGESWKNTNKMMIFDSDLFYSFFLYLWVYFDRPRLKSKVQRRGLDSLRFYRENQNIASLYFRGLAFRGAFKDFSVGSRCFCFDWTLKSCWFPFSSPSLAICFRCYQRWYTRSLPRRRENQNIGFYGMAFYLENTIP